MNVPCMVNQESGFLCLLLSDGSVKVPKNVISSNLIDDLISPSEICSCKDVFLHLPDFAISHTIKLVELLRSGETMVEGRRDYLEVVSLKRVLDCKGICKVEKEDISSRICRHCKG